MDAVAEKPEKQKRRVRWERQSTGRRVTPGAREAVWFQKLWEHGPLPTTYLYEYTKDITPSKDVVQHRLTDLFHEDNTPHGGYFELKYGDAGYRAFLLEADRENEPVKSNNLDRTSYLRKLLQYRQLIGTGRYKEHFGIRAGMLVLTVTTSFAHMDSIIALLMKLTDGRGAPYMLFKAYPAFAGRNIAAQPVLSELLTTPWRRAGFPDIDISKP